MNEIEDDPVFRPGQLLRKTGLQKEKRFKQELSEEEEWDSN